MIQSFLAMIGALCVSSSAPHLVLLLSVLLGMWMWLCSVVLSFSMLLVVWVSSVVMNFMMYPFICACGCSDVP